MSQQAIIPTLFRSRKPLNGFDRIRGQQEIPAGCVARRNETGKGSVSKMIAKAIMTVLAGRCHSAELRAQDRRTEVVYETTGSGGDTRRSALRFDRARRLTHLVHPSALTYGITYHAVMGFIVEALAFPEHASDFLHAYQAVLDHTETFGCRDLSTGYYNSDVDFVDAFWRACDELYYWIRYGDGDVRRDVDRTDGAEITAAAGGVPLGVFPISRTISLAPLTDPNALRRLRNGKLVASVTDLFRVEDAAFRGPQLGVTMHAFRRRQHVLAIGPTGTGKTACFAEALDRLDYGYEMVRGAENLLDLDFVGGIVPTTDGHRWVDGPLVRAFRRTTGGERVVFWVDELTRIPSRMLNLLLGTINPVAPKDLAAMGVLALGDGPFYVLEVPETHEVLVAEADKLSFAASANMGRQYAVHDMDPALMRRFTYQVEFKYLGESDEADLVEDRTGATAPIPAAVAHVAARTREMYLNALLPLPLDTAGALCWAAEAQALVARGVNPSDALQTIAQWTWIPRVAGLDHAGAVDTGTAAGLEDLVKDAIKDKGGSR